MDLLAPLHPVADMVDLASEAVAAVAVTITAAAHWLLPCDTDKYPPLQVVASGSGGRRRPGAVDGSNDRPTMPPRRPTAAR